MLSRGAPLGPDVIVGPTRRMAHRGPDGEGIWTSEDGRAALGHRRLSLIDLTTGGQPLFNEDGTIVAVVNGELYDFERIRRELEAAGHQFRTRSDSEILLHLYEDLGTDCLHRLRGEFAFALWDGRSRTMFAARDRFGIKPLVFGSTGHALVLASEVKALFAAGVPAAWDEASFGQHVFACMDQDRTLFRGVSQVPPGHFLLATAEAQRVVRYWDLDYPASGDTPIRPDAEHVAELRDALDEAVRIRMRADVEVGCMLSGGLDSSTVLALASRHAPGRVSAFTTVFDHAAYDEGAAASEVAAHVGATFSPHRAGYAELADAFVEAAWHGESICFNAHAIARFLLAREIRRAGVKAVVAGEGADEVFAGYVFSRQDMLTAERGAAPVPAHFASVRDKLGSVPHLFQGLADSRGVFRELLAPELVHELGRRDPYLALLGGLDVAGQLEGRHPMLQGIYLWSKSLLPNYVLAAERLDMAHGIEVRQPFLDHQVFELVRRMPPSLLVRNDVEKFVLREAARPWLPDRTYRMPKQPFTAPPATLTLHNPLLTLLQDQLRSRSMAACPLVNHRAVRALLDALPRMSAGRRIALDSVLLMLGSAAILHDRFIHEKAT